MSTSVNTSVPPIGMAPASSAQQPVQPATFGGVESMQWVAPATAVGGGAVAARGFMKSAAAAAGGMPAPRGNGFMKMAGTLAAIAGVGLMTFGNKLQGRVAVPGDPAAQGASQGNVLAGGGASGGQAAPGAQATGADVQAMMGANDLSRSNAVVATQVPANSFSVTGGGASPVAWTSDSLRGASVSLPGDEGTTWNIEQLAGDPAGYASLIEAHNGSRSGLGTGVQGVNYLRWVVVQHDDRFYGAVAKEALPNASSPPLAPESGSVASWSALQFDPKTANRSSSGWMAYEWSKELGMRSAPVASGTARAFPEQPVPAATPTAPASAEAQGADTRGGGPVTDAPGAAVPQGAERAGGVVVAGGAPSTAFDASTVVGRSFAINASMIEGSVVRGGALQLQAMVSASTGGFGTMDEAAMLARAVRDEIGGDKWARVVTMQGSDGRYYVYEGSIVNSHTMPLEQAAPVHVFGGGFAEYFDGAISAWRAVPDS